MLLIRDMMASNSIQPVYVGDLARLVEVISRDDTKISQARSLTLYLLTPVIEKLVLKYTRPILSLPFAVGKLQGTIMEQLPTNLFTCASERRVPRVLLL